jgi:PAS domain S-box-containing protein
MQTRDEQERLTGRVTDEPAPAQTTFGAAQPPGRVGPQLQATLNLIPAHTWYASASGALIFVNERASDYLGLPKDHPLRLGIDNGGEWDSHIALLHPDDHEEARGVWSTCLRNGSPGQMSFRVRNAEGRYRWFLSRAEPVRASDGTLLYWIGINLDIEDRKQAEFYLAEGQRLARMGSWVFNAAGFDYWSPELFRIHGLDPSGKAPTVEEYVGLVHPDDREFVMETIQKMFAEGRGFDFTKRIVRPDGEIRSVRCVGVPSTHGTCQGFVGTGIDVTEQERILDELRRSEFYLAEGQRLGHAGSWSFKPDGTCDYWSRELYQILGFDPNGGIPTIPDYFTRVHPQDREVVETTIQRMIAAGEGCDLKKRIIRPDGVQRVIRCVGMPVREKGVVTRFVGTLMDITEQEELTQELRRREAYLAEAQRLSHTGSFGWNYGATGELTWSEETYRICGFDRSTKPTFQLVRERVHPDDLQVWQQAFDRVAEGKEVDFENKLVMPDGTVKFLHSVAYGVQKDGKFVELVGTVMDITERKRAEETIRRSEAYLAEAQRLSKTGSFAWSPTAGNTYYSEECCRVLGFEPQGAPPPPFEAVMQRIHPDDQARCRELVEKAIRDKADVELDYRIVHPDKRVRDIHCVGHVVLNRSGKLVEIVGTVFDITERKRAEEAIRRSEAFLAEGQRLSHTGSWGWNASTGKVTWSQEHFRILGLDPQDTIPSLDVFWERVHPDDRIGLQRTFESAIRDKRDFEQEFRIVIPDSSIRHLHGVGHAILNKANELVEFIGSAMDITERKRADAALQETRAELERVIRVTTMGELAASIAHEINQPLAGVVTSANAGLNWLAANPPNLPKTRETLERILRDGTRGGEVLARIRALLKRTPPAKTLVSVNQIARDMLALTAGELRQHQIELLLDLTPTVAVVLGDTVQLQQVLLNLIKNAIEAMAAIANGQRTLRIQSRPGELETKPAVILEVSDTGVGFSSSETTRLFEAFHTTKPQGMGMGLWISRSIVESHHGRLTASSNHKHGATFVITLPKADQEQA